MHKLLTSQLLQDYCNIVVAKFSNINVIANVKPSHTKVIKCWSIYVVL